MAKSKPYTFPCLQLKQGEHSLICFIAPASLIWEFSQINTRDPDKESGYQRTLSRSRVNSIANYVDEGNSIPNSILISLNEAKLVNNETQIQIPRKEDAAWVIDGQHRLAGAHEAKTDTELTVIAFIGLDVTEQIKQFVTINREAKGVPTSLYYDLLKHLPPLKSPTVIAKERAVDIAHALRKDEQSPFYDRIVVITPPKRGWQISLTNFVRKVFPLFVDIKGKLHTYTYEEQLKIIDNYYRALRNIFPSQFRGQKQILFMTLGFGAVMNAFPTVFDLAIQHFSGFTVKDVSEILRNVDYFDFSVWETMGTGSAAEIQAGEDFRQELLKIMEQEVGPGSLRL